MPHGGNHEGLPSRSRPGRVRMAARADGARRKARRKAQKQSRARNRR